MADSEKAKIEMIAGYPQEVVMQMLAAGSITRRQAELADKIKYSRGIRDKEGPKGIQTRNAYVAASPLSHIARGMRQYKAGKNIKEYEGEITGLDEKYETGMADALRAYGRRQDVAGRGGTIRPGGAATFPMPPPPQAQMSGGEFFQGSQPTPPRAGVGIDGQMLGDGPMPPPQAQPPVPQPPPLGGLPPGPPGPAGLNTDPYAGKSVTVGDIPPNAGRMQQFAEGLRKMGINLPPEMYGKMGIF